MDRTINPTPVNPCAPQTDAPAEWTDPKADALRALREASEAIAADCRQAPDEYLDEVQVPCGGE